MKILHVSTPLTWRGGEQQLAYLIEELKNKGVEQVVLCAAGSAVERFCQLNNLNCYTFNRRFLQLVPASMINSICQKESINLIHTHDSHGHTAVVLSSILFGNLTPHVVSRRTIFPIGTNWFSKFKYNHSSVARIVCVSDKIKEQVSATVTDKRKLVTIHSGIDLNRFRKNHEEDFDLSELGADLQHPFIGNVAALSSEKDYFTFIDTAETFYRKGKEGTFFIIGDGPLKSEIEKYIVEKGLKGKIVLTGFRKNIAAIIKQLDCFLFTSHTEGFGTSILDAMASQIPVVVTRTGGIPEIVIHGYNGLLAPVKDPNALADCLIKVTDDTTLRKMLIHRASDYVYNFTNQKMALHTFDIYKEVLYEKSLEQVPLFFPSMMAH